MRDTKIPQAVAWVLLMSALAAAQAGDVKPTGGRPGGNVTPVRAQVEVTNLLKEFLANVDKPEMHERFWADDLIYTSGTGAVKTKADILKSMREDVAKSGPPRVTANQETYDADDIRVRQYGETAVLNFQLVQHVPGKPDNKFRNTGTFVKRNGQWQAVVWQATKIPANAEVSKSE